MLLNLILCYLLICFQLPPFALIGIIMHNRLKQFKCFSLVEKKFDYVIREPPICLRTLNMLIGELKMHKLGVACGITWSLRSIVVWFSYQLLNLFGNRLKNLFGE